VNRSVPSASGNPVDHNRRRIWKRALNRMMEGWIHVHTPGGRRRKKHITKVEGANIRALVATGPADERGSGMSPAMIGIAVWMILLSCAWAPVHGAAKFRTMEDQVRSADLADVVEFAPPAVKDATGPNRQAA
jgi:hypothetical protein